MSGELFSVEFASEMTAHDAALLERVLHLSSTMAPALRPSPARPGFARLDFESGLYLERGEEEGRWRLRARTWGRPAPSWVAAWRRIALRAARELDPQARLLSGEDSLQDCCHSWLGEQRHIERHA